MNSRNEREVLCALITQLADKAPNGYIGRTALMKFCYFLQTLRKIPLGYSFSLYSYGPFDSKVLSDLNFAETIGAVKSDVSLYPGGYGYEIKKGEAASRILAAASSHLAAYQESIDWVLSEFGEFSSADLELLATIVFVNREANYETGLGIMELVQRVRDVKPRFQEYYIREKAEWLKKQGLLEHVK